MDSTILMFDYDGTIHETLKIYEPAMRNTLNWLKEEHGMTVPDVSSRQIASWLGLNIYDIWNSAVPGIDDKLKFEAGDRVANQMAELTKAGCGKWYDGLYEQLVYLKSKGYIMVVLSNCQTAYKDLHWKTFSMSKIFSKFYDCESYGYMPKEDIFQYIRKEYPGRRYIMIGDRFNDMICATANNIPGIGCLYGYGSKDELSKADILINAPSELSDAVAQLT